MANLPLIPQTLNQYPPIAENMWPGMPVQEDNVRGRSASALVAKTPFVKEQWDVQVTFGAGGDTFGIVIQGAYYLAEALTDDEISAQAWITANGQLLVNANILSTLPVTDGAGLITLLFVDGLFPTVSGYSPDATTVTANQIVVGDGPDIYLTWGMGVIKDPLRRHPNVDLIVRRPKTEAEVLNYFKMGGVVKWGPMDTDDSRTAQGYPSAVDIAPDAFFRVYQVNSYENPYVHFATMGNPAPALEGQDAYLVFDQTHHDWGKFRADNGGAVQIVELTFSGAGAGTVAGNFDGLFDISFADTGVDADNAAQWAALANGNVQYSSIATYEAVGDVVTVTFKDTSAHVFTDTSVGGPAITDATTQTAVAAIAAPTGLKFLLASVAARPGIVRAALNMNS